MKKFVLFLAVSAFLSGGVFAQTDSPGKPELSDTLVVLWTSGDPDVAERVCLMYTHAAKTQKWFDEVILVVWGPSAKLISENLKLRAKVKSMENDGVLLEACVACANSYGVAAELSKFGFDVKGMGKPLTDYLKSDDVKVLTF
ncbi:DsrE family protein [Marinilabilia rubra]|uniref:DsrE family protein n=1 Tax=Marinilabilia rubra TaxID=2162893 RepID=A0A2U2B7U6_9BACT|nr:DsrE family protein [Marinilabilia rubra]PWD99140.1 DsrE family protein [Marinilabilia rubra]